METLSNSLYLASFAACLYMTGLIWFVQIVHYPLFAKVGHEAFATYEHAHVRRTSWVVVLPMLVELFTAAGLLYVRPVWCSPFLATTSLFLVGIVWASTFLLQVPQHARLERGFDGRAHGRLVWTNLVRAAAWTARSAVLLFGLARAL